MGEEQKGSQWVYCCQLSLMSPHPGVFLLIAGESRRTPDGKMSTILITRVYSDNRCGANYYCQNPTFVLSAGRHADE